MKKVSYSQFSMWSNCKQQYKLAYIDNLRTSSANISTIFGTSMHEVIQEFLTAMYTETKSKAFDMNLQFMLRDKLIENFNKEKNALQEGLTPCTKEELDEHYQDGKLILIYFKNKLAKFFTKKGYKLVGIEIVLDAMANSSVKFIGYIDIAIEDLSDGTITIYDLKTSTSGWGSYQKNDTTKTSQLLLYKKIFSEKFNVSLDKIKVEYVILRRKIDPNAEFPIPRVSRFVPANGKPSINKAWKSFQEFLDYTFTADGEYNITNEYPFNKTKACDWCEFKKRRLCPGWFF